MTSNSSNYGSNRRVPAFVEPVLDTREVALVLMDDEVVMLRQLLRDNAAKAKQDGRQDRYEWLGEVIDKLNRGLHPEGYGC